MPEHADEFLICCQDLSLIGVDGAGKSDGGLDNDRELVLDGNTP
jgi:hypothetical protein